MFFLENRCFTFWKLFYFRFFVDFLIKSSSEHFCTSTNLTYSLATKIPPQNPYNISIRLGLRPRTTHTFHRLNFKC